MVDKNTGATPTDTKAGNSALPQDFETALAQLETLVAEMENGSLALDQSLAAYEQGVELAKICQRRLDQAEQQVKVLQGNLLKPLDDTPAGDEE
ncbi:exodeoxyribonuclease VII small subunit [Alcaligenaceae bacterium]|nr:exodeoxyribonuclease VII small subunit [Alcaligenaceae bacterium]